MIDDDGERQARGDAHGVRVLVVDDTETDAATIGFVLGHGLEGVTTRWLDDGRRIGDEIEHWQPHVVLTDAHMPRFDVLEALAEVRARWPLLPVIVVSGAVGDEVAAQLIRAGANDFVAKPGLSRLPMVVERELRDARERAERAGLQARLKHQQDLFARVLESLPVGVWVADDSGTIVHDNPAGRRIWDGARFAHVDGWRRCRGWRVDDGSALAPDAWAAVRVIAQGQAPPDECIEIETAAGRRKVVLGAAVPLHADGRLLGAFVVHQDITELHRTEQRLRRAEQTLRGLSQRLLDAQEQERRWIAQELHDDIGQAIAAMRFQFARIAGRAGGGETAALAADALRSSEQLGQRLRQICLGLRPLELDDFGLMAALRSLVAPLRRPQLDVTLVAEGAELRYPPPVETAAFRIAQEAVANALRHSGCRSLALRLRLQPHTLELEVRDDGCGFDPDAAAPALRTRRLGLAGMEERARAASGRLVLVSTPGTGCTVQVVFDVRAAGDESLPPTEPAPLEPPPR